MSERGEGTSLKPDETSSHSSSSFIAFSSTDGSAEEEMLNKNVCLGEISCFPLILCAAF